MGVRCMDKKNYRNLMEEVWNTDICSGCGACIAVCPADSLFYNGVDTHPVSTGYCIQENNHIPCGACYAVCPRTSLRNQTKKEIGDYISITGAQAVVDSVHRQSGGAVTAILTYALQNNLIDAVVTVTEDRWTKKPSSTLITSAGDILTYAGSRYSWYTPVLSALKTAVIEKKFHSIAVVGVPCAVSAVRLMKESDNDLILPFKKAIRLVIGLFCTEIFDYNKLFSNQMNTLSVRSWDITRMDIKRGLIIEQGDGSTQTINLSDLLGSVRTGCHSCQDFTAQDADISAGSIGTPDGYTTLITRTSIGKGFVDGAVRAGILLLSDNVSKDPIIAHASKKREKNS